MKHEGNMFISSPYLFVLSSPFSWSTALVHLFLHRSICVLRDSIYQIWGDGATELHYAIVLPGSVTSYRVDQNRVACENARMESLTPSRGTIWMIWSSTTVDAYLVYLSRSPLSLALPPSYIMVCSTWKRTRRQCIDSDYVYQHRKRQWDNRYDMKRSSRQDRESHSCKKTFQDY